MKKSYKNIKFLYQKIFVHTHICKNLCVWKIKNRKVLEFYFLFIKLKISLKFYYKKK